VAAQFKTTLEKIDHLTAALKTAEDLVQEATDQLGAAGAGSAQEYEFSQVVSRWTDVAESTSILLDLVSTIRTQIEQLLHDLVGDGSPHKPTKDQPPKPPHAGADPAPETTWAERQREQLPKYITSGIYVDPDGNTEIVQSGQEVNGTHQQVADHLRNLGFPAGPRGRVTMGEHVEGKVAWRQRNSGVDHVELVVNNEMCQGMYSCRKLVPFILKPGQTLVIHDPVTSRVFHGRSLS
jgi:hypothetical protein